MKSTSSLIIVVLIGLLAVVASWIYFSQDNEPVPSIHIGSQSTPNKASEYSASPSVEGTAIAKADAVVFLDATGEFNLNGLTVAQYVKKYRDAADKGDKTAAFNIYRAEKICARIPQLQRNLEAMRSNSDTTARNGAQFSLKVTQSACSDFNENPRERHEYLLIAAKGGNTAAQLAYANDPPEEIARAYELDQMDSGAMQWQREAVGFLTQAANNGNKAALLELATIYAVGKIAPQDLQLALTYQLALAQLSDPNNQGNFSINNQEIGNLASRLTPNQISAANTAATALVNSCCSKH